MAPDVNRVPRARVHGLRVSLDGYAAGTYISKDRPIGDAAGVFEGFDARFIHGIDAVDAPVTADDALTSTWGQGIGAEIMGRGKFTPETGPWRDEEWRGWWGEEPPFCTPVFVLTHHPRSAMEFDNGTVFHFVDASPQKALRLATEAAGGLDVRIGGGPSSIRDFLAADLVDLMHFVTLPIVLGRGTALWDGLRGIEERFDIEVFTTPSGQTHHLWNRRPRDGEETR